MNEEEKEETIHKCEIYSRVVGYLSPVSEWNKGKTEEFHDRQEYKTVKES